MRRVHPLSQPHRAQARPPQSQRLPSQRGAGRLSKFNGNRPLAFDIDGNTSGDDLNVNGAFYSSLMLLDGKGNIQPDLATSWDSLDGGKALRFHLRPNVKFTDGSPLTADDVVWSLNKMMGKVAGFGPSPRMGVLSAYVESVRADDPQTVTVQLGRPAPIVLTLLAQQFAGITKKDTTSAELKKQRYRGGSLQV